MDIEPSTKEELAKLGTQALKDLYENLAGAKQFVLAQAPDICQQMIAWQVAKAALAAVIFVCFLAAGCVFYRVYNRATKDPARFARDEEIAPGVTAAVLFILAFTTSVIALIEGVCATQAIVAPKLFLLERIAAMLR